MLKTKYERMNKEEKKEVLKKYKNTDKGKEMMMRLYRLNVIGIIGILYCIFFIITELSRFTWKSYLIVIPLFLISIFFLFMSYRLKKKVLNQFAIKKNL